MINIIQDGCANSLPRLYESTYRFSAFYSYIQRAWQYILKSMLRMQAFHAKENHTETYLKCTVPTKFLLYFSITP